MKNNNNNERGVAVSTTRVKRTITQCIVVLGCNVLIYESAYSEHETTHLPTLEVVGTAAETPLTTPSIEQAREELNRIPGGVSLIDAEDFSGRFVGGIQNALQFAPGVFAQSRFGGAETRLSIRGSGVTQTFGIRGVRFLRDGLPVTEPGGFTNPELIEPLTARHIEVYRGANALQYGAATLGGAVNFVSRTGRNTPGVGLRMMYGAYQGGRDYVRPQVTAGGVLGDVDYFAALSALYQDGFRAQSREWVARGYANLGYRWNDRSESRIHLTAQNNELELPGSLTEEQLRDDPSQANAFWEMRNAQRNLDRLRFDFHHTFLLGHNDRLDIGTYYENVQLDHPLPFVFIDNEDNNAGLSFRFEHAGQLQAHDNRVVVGGLLVWGEVDGKEFSPTAVGRKGSLNKDVHDESMTAELFAEDQFALTPTLNLVVGAQAVHARRRAVDDFADSAELTAKNTKDYTGFSPKLGLVWQATDTVQLYGNVSRSYEPPTDIEFTNGLRELDAQEAITVELGTRGAYGILSWDVAAYHAWLNNEILSQERPPIPSGRFDTDNADDTTHSGVEVGAQAAIPLGFWGEDRIDVRAVYTYNRFRFDGDKTFGDNKLPGIPENFGTLEVLYKHPSGFYIGPNVQYADNYFVDFANTLKADSYTLYGARAGYDSRKGYKVFLEARNLTDRKWISNTGVTPDAGGMDNALFNPGFPLSVFGGIEISLF